MPILISVNTAMIAMKNLIVRSLLDAVKTGPFRTVQASTAQVASASASSARRMLADQWPLITPAVQQNVS